MIGQGDSGYQRWRSYFLIRHTLYRFYKYDTHLFISGLYSYGRHLPTNTSSTFVRFVRGLCVRLSKRRTPSSLTTTNDSQVEKSCILALVFPWLDRFWLFEDSLWPTKASQGQPTDSISKQKLRSWSWVFQSTYPGHQFSITVGCILMQLSHWVMSLVMASSCCLFDDVHQRPSSPPIYL